MQPSNISTNSIVNDVTAINDYFRFVDDFAGTPERPVLDISSDINEVGNGNNVVRAAISLYPPLSTIPVSEHIKEKNGSKVITTGEKAKFGEMSFRMITDNDPFDITGFRLKTSEKYSPETGIKINLDTIHCYEKSDPKTGVFRFTDVTASKDASLSDLIVSNEKDPNSATYKTYNLTKSVDEATLGDKDRQGFDSEILNYELSLMEYLDTINIKAIKNDQKSKVVAKVVKKGTDGQADEEKIIYDETNETELKKEIPIEVTLNKLGEPDTEIKIEVIAEDGVTKNTYKVVIKRPYGTIKGSIYTAPTADKGIYKADIRVYKTSDVVNIIDWGEVATSTNGDTVHDDLLTLKSQDYKTNDDGTYEIYVIPGTYDILLDKCGYLDHIYISRKVNEGEIEDLGNKELLAGDINKDGVVQLRDLTTLKTYYGIISSDGNDYYDNEELDFNEDGEIQLRDLTTLKSNYGKYRIIE